MAIRCLRDSCSKKDRLTMSIGCMFFTLQPIFFVEFAYIVPVDCDTMSHLILIEKK